MQIKNAKFLVSKSGKESFPDFAVPELAVVGRSNVGKSSFINMLANVRGLAKASSTPGRTRLINYFLFNGQFVLVDLPGYGFAKAAKDDKAFWEQMITSYFAESKQLAGIVMLVDVRITPTEKDQTMMEYLTSYHIPFVVVATKLDKIKRSQMEQRKIDIAAALKVGKENVLMVSNQTGTGREAVLSKLEQLISAFKGESL